MAWHPACCVSDLINADLKPTDIPPDSSHDRAFLYGQKLRLIRSSLTTLPGTLSRLISSTCTPVVLITTRGEYDLAFSQSAYAGLSYCAVTSRSSTPPSQSATGTCGKNTTRRWSTAGICRPSSTGGDTTPTEQRKLSRRSRSSRRFVYIITH